MHRQFAFRTIDLRAQRAGGWRMWLGLALAGAAATALLLVFGLVMLLLLPVFVIAAFVGRWWLGRELKKAAAQAQGRQQAGVIEGHYEVVEQDGPVGRGWGPRR